MMRYVLESGEFDDRNWFNNIKKLITMGTPHRGAPLALFRLGGTDPTMGLSGPTVKQIANDPRYSSLFELNSPASTSLVLRDSLPGQLPQVTDPFDPGIASAMQMNQANIDQARTFWSKLKTEPRNGVEYFYFVGSAHKTIVRNYLPLGSNEPMPISRKSAGDGTVPISSAVVADIPHGFSMKKHEKIFNDRSLRKLLYRFLDAPSESRPQAANASIEVGSPNVLGISVDKETYQFGEEIEVALSYSKEVTDPEETLELFAYDLESENRIPDFHRTMTVKFKGVRLNNISFSISEDLPAGLFELRSLRAMDDPEPNFFFVRERGASGDN